MMAAAGPMADPQLEFHWIPDPGFLIQGFLIQGFLIQCLHRIDGFTMENTTHPAPALSFSYRASFTPTVNAPSKDARLPLGYPCVLASAARPLPFSLPKNPNFGLQGSCVLTARP